MLETEVREKTFTTNKKVHGKQPQTFLLSFVVND